MMSYKRNLVLSISFLIFFGGSVLLTAISRDNFYVFIGIPLALVCWSVLFFQRCPHCGNRPMYRVNAKSLFTLRWFLVFPKKCDKCGQPFNQKADEGT